ncbi:MAG TPA: 4Fe-4S dicluster domain-containing protein [Bdellovibrionota bacterium]|nr:4Fe-4S dicluster domain-containing protein [Bdellovibrionota bacterium]
MPISGQVPRESSSSLPIVPLTELARLQLFKDIPAGSLESLEGSVHRATIDQGETILELAKEKQLFENFYFIAHGHVKVIGLDEEARVKPLNFLRKGDFFVDKSVNWRSQVATKAVAMTGVELLILPREEFRRATQSHHPLEKKLKELADRIDYRNRIYSEDRYARSVMEFLIETELTQASRIKITEMDKCIECNTCYQSCEERHGFQRLERGYAHFGVLDFAKSCLTCFYPTCIPACPVDSVLFNPKNGEVEIDDSCIGCSACARACQYGAIKMYKVVPDDARFARFLKPGKKIKPKFIADKCNHCDGYDDMVCITNCPTGAIIEVEASDLFDNPRVFGAGAGAWHRLPSKIERHPVELALQKFYVLLGFLGTFWLLWEAYALNRFPAASILKQFQLSGVIPSDFGLEFRRGSQYCNFLGNAGFALILFALLYPLRKGFPKLFKYFGKKPLWLDFHNFCGIFGTILVLFHTGFVFPFQPSTFGFLALVAVAASGVFGRFLYQAIPRRVAGTELEMKEIEEEDAAITQKLDALMEGSTKHRDLIRAITQSLAQDAERNPTLWSYIRSVVKTYWLLWRLRIYWPKELRIHRRQIGVFLTLLHEKLRLQRNVAFLSLSSRLFVRWQYIHRPFAYIMSAIAIGHVIRNLIFFPNL